MTIRKMVALAAMVLLASCSPKEAKETSAKAVAKVQSAAEKVGDDVVTPWDNKPEDRAAREQQRFDAQWRQLQSFRQQQAAQAAAAAKESAQAATPPATFQFVAAHKETFKNLSPEAINAAPVSVPIHGDVAGPSVLRAQVYLDRVHFSVGAIDGRWGRNSAITVWWWQRAHGLPATGDLDEATFRSIAAAAAYAPVVRRYALADDDMKGPFSKIPDDVYEKANLDCLCYETVKEKLAEQFHVDQDFFDVLNPDVKWSELQAGASIVVPNVRDPWAGAPPDIASIVVSIAGNNLNGFDGQGRLVFHAPTTVGSGYDPSPSEKLRVVKIVANPHFHYDPTLYHEVPDSDPDAMLPAGPNTPVGVVWIALSKEHYGIHGTADPESIGYASSHGCVRLTNWDAAELSHRIAAGTPVDFVDTRGGDEKTSGKGRH